MGLSDPFSHKGAVEARASGARTGVLARFDRRLGRFGLVAVPACDRATMRR